MGSHTSSVTAAYHDAPQRQMTVSLIICCYRADRWNDLGAAIDSALRQEPCLDEIIVVVDHNPDLMTRVISAYPPVKVMENVGPRGLSGARNSGVAASTCELVAFLDDDAVADPDMIAQLRRCLERETVLGAMAEIVPDWLGRPPAWLPAEFLWVVGCTYRSMERGRVRNLLGAAMCFRRTVFEAIGGFNSGLGRNHSALPLGCEETEFCIRANRAHPGFHFEYQPSARCLHKVPDARGTWTYFVRRCYAEGWSKAHVAFISQAAGSLHSERFYVTRTVPLGAMRGIVHFFRHGENAGLGRAAASVLGIAAAAAGYGVARLSLIANPARASALRQLPSGLACDQ